jgi:transposase-like protein
LNWYGFSAAPFWVEEDLVMPKRIDPAVRARAVRLVRDHLGEYASLTAAVTAVAMQERVAVETVRRWVRQAEVDAGVRAGASSDELAENQRLRAENARLREDVAILKAAATFFAGELDPRNR